MTTIRDLLQRRPDGTPIPGSAPPHPLSRQPAIVNATHVVDVLSHALGVSVDLAALPKDEQVELGKLVAKSQQDAPPDALVNLAALSSKEQRRVEKLAEQALGEPGLFARVRQEQEHAAQVAALAARANRPAPVTSTLSRDVLDQLAGGFMTLDELAVLSFLSVVLDAAEVPPAWANGMRFTDGALVLTFVPVQIDPRQSNLAATLGHLQANDWLEVDGDNRGPWVIRPGQRFRTARRAA